MIKLKEPEKLRTYIWSDGSKVVIKGVTHFCASQTTHRLKTKDGLHHIIPNGWNHIELDIKSFTI